MTIAPAKMKAPATALPARYLVDAGNGSPDEYDTFASAHAAWLKWTRGRGKLWRNDESDAGEHLDGLSTEERRIVEEPLEDARAEAEHLARISRPHPSESDAARRSRGLTRIWLPVDVVAELDALCEGSGLSRADQIQAWARAEREELAAIGGHKMKTPRAG